MALIIAGIAAGIVLLLIPYFAINTIFVRRGDVCHMRQTLIALLHEHVAPRL